MSRTSDVLLTAAAPAIWGSTYIVTTEFLPAGYPLTVAMLRALPAGLLLLLLVRQLPTGIWWPRTFLLGALNFSFFWADPENAQCQMDCSSARAQRDSVGDSDQLCNFALEAIDIRP